MGQNKFCFLRSSLLVIGRWCFEWGFSFCTTVGVSAGPSSIPSLPNNNTGFSQWSTFTLAGVKNERAVDGWTILNNKTCRTPDSHLHSTWAFLHLGTVCRMTVHVCVPCLTHLQNQPHLYFSSDLFFCRKRCHCYRVRLVFHCGQVEITNVKNAQWKIAQKQRSFRLCFLFQVYDGTWSYEDVVLWW